MIKSNPTYKSLPQSSRGFSNKDIGLLNDKSLIQKTTENVANYCKTHDIGTKLADAFEVIAILGLVALEAAAAYNAASIPTYTPVVMQPAPQVRPMVVPNWKYTFNAKTKHVDRYYNSVTIRSFY